VTMRPIPQAYEAAEQLEKDLGHPASAESTFSFRNCVDLDERDAYPEDIVRALDERGVHRYYVPSELGGAIVSYEEVLAVLRTIARRDLSVAIAHAKSYLGAVAIWIAGSTGQQRDAAALVLGGKQMALALTERAHGGDLLACDVRAERVPTGYRLTGQKWLINNGTRGAGLTLYARTDPKGGPRGFSLLFVDKSKLREGSFSHHPKILTHGIRGADISGVAFEGATVGPDAVIGKEGAGLEIIIKALQLTRTMCTGLSLGAADTALRVATEFALSRRLYRDVVFAIPHARATLVDAYADLLLCDAVSIAAARAVHVAPDQLSVRSAIVKYFVPTASERIVRDVAVVLGARHYVRRDYADGVFQKLVRDNALVGLFDGSTVVNLSALGLQLRQLANRRGKLDERQRDALRERLAPAFTLGGPLPRFDPTKLDLASHGDDDAVQGMAIAIASVEQERARGRVAAPVADAIVDGARALLEELHADERRVDVLVAGTTKQATPPALFELAKRYAAIHAAACALHLWTNNRGGDDAFARGEWLALALRRALVQFRPALGLLDRPFEDAVAADLVRRVDEGRLFSAVAVKLA
jgi:alkylation response protein AidB-like acyl-CoA dehydrogenase